MSFHFVVRFTTRPGKADEFREAIRAVAEPTRAEPGCLFYRAFESLREPIEFSIYSEFVDEEAFELHASLPHTVRFIETASECLTHPIKGLRCKLIAGS
jgi:quinol monooxygenase YgiN